MDKKYEIVRYYKEGGQKVVRKNATLEEARAHCNNPETSSAGTSARSRKITEEHGEWFDGYREM